MERAHKRLQDAAMLLVDRVLDRNGYDALRGGTRRAPTLPPFEQVLAELASWSNVLAGLDTRAERDVISQLIEQVIPERGDRRGKYRMRIVLRSVGDALRRLGSAVRRDVGD